MADTIKIILKGYHRSEDWTETVYYCPICGKQAVWMEDGAGDYYSGPAIMCAVCGGTMQHPEAACERGADPDRFAVLRHHLKARRAAARKTHN